jgi:hypothetical protein
MTRDGELNWTASVEVPPNDLAPITYHYTAVDIHGNSRNSTEISVEVLDNDPPEIVEVLMNGSVDAGSSIVIEAVVQDNIGVMEAEIQWWLGGDPDKKEVTMEIREDGTFTATIPVEMDSYGSLYFVVISSDPSGNTGQSDRLEVGIIEYVPLQEGDDDDIVTDDDDVDPVDDDDPPADDDDTCPGDDDDDTTRIPKEGEDIDQDGMDDLWECRNGLDIDLDDSDLDSDGDNYSNLEEFKAGTDPSDISSFPKPSGNAGKDDPTDLFLIIGLAVAVLGVILVALVWAVVRRRDRPDPSASMVLDDDEDDEVMSWD